MKIGKTPGDHAYAEAIKPIRNRLRTFDYDSALTAVAAYLQGHNRSSSLDHLQRLPWVAERLALWLLTDCPAQYNHRHMSQEDVVDCINQAWHMIDRLDKANDIEDIHLFVRQMMLSQAPYQVGLNVGAFGRQIRMIQWLPPESNLRKSLDQSVGMPIESYFELALLFWIRSEGGELDFPRSYLKSLADAFGKDAVEHFIQRIAYSKAEVQARLREARTLALDEWFQPTLLYKFPYVTTSSSILCWGAPTLRRHFENVITDWIEDDGDQAAKQTWDKVFSNYIGESLQKTECEVLNEREVQHKLGIHGKVCDYLLVEPEYAVLIEVKNKSLTETLPARATRLTMKSKLKATVAKAVGQIANTLRAAKKHPELANKEFYSVIVTAGDLWLGPGHFLHDDIDTEGSSGLHIVSADQFDHLCELARLGRISVGSFLRELSLKNLNPSTFVHSPGFLLEQKPYALHKPPAHLLETCDVVTERLRRRLL